ncbi:MAG: C-type lectin domain-containing protein [Planctomycetaceae bacterium]
MSESLRAEVFMQKQRETCFRIRVSTYVIPVCVAMLLFALDPTAVSASPIYFAGTGNHYEHIVGSFRWDSATAAATNLTFEFNGTTHNGHLANIGSSAENQFLSDHVFASGEPSAWVGGTDGDTEGTWTWAGGPEAGQVFFIAGTGTVAGQFSNWAVGEPNNSGNEDALLFRGGGGWNDGRIGDGLHGYIVEFETAAVPEPSPLQLLMSLAVAGVLYRTTRTWRDRWNSK